MIPKPKSEICKQQSNFLKKKTLGFSLLYILQIAQLNVLTFSLSLKTTRFKPALKKRFASQKQLLLSYALSHNTYSILEHVIEADICNYPKYFTLSIGIPQRNQCTTLPHLQA